MSDSYINQKASKASDKISDTAQRMKPESEKTFGEKAREKINDTWDATKEKGSELSDKISDTAQRMKPESEKTYTEKAREKINDTKDELNKQGSEYSDKISDTAERMKPESEKTYTEKARERVSDTWEATKEKVHDLGTKLGLTSESEKPVDEQLKETGGNISDKVSDTAERMKPESEKTYTEKAREKVSDTWEATKEKVHDLGTKLGLTSESEKPVEQQFKETGANLSDDISDTAQRMKPESEKTFGEKAREKISDTWDATKEKVHDLGNKMGVTSESERTEVPRE